MDSVFLEEIVSSNIVPLGLIIRLSDVTDFRIAMMDPLSSMRLEQEIKHVLDGPAAS